MHAHHFARHRGEPAAGFVEQRVGAAGRPPPLARGARALVATRSTRKSMHCRRVHSAEVEFQREDNSHAAIVPGILIMVVITYGALRLAEHVMPATWVNGMASHIPFRRTGSVVTPSTPLTTNWIPMHKIPPSPWRSSSYLKNEATWNRRAAIAPARGCCAPLDWPRRAGPRPRPAARCASYFSFRPTRGKRLAS